MTKKQVLGLKPLELRLRLPTALDADPHQFAHALAVDGDERIARENPARHVGAEKARGVVAADAEGGLGQVVGAEGKEFRGLGDSDLVGDFRSSGPTRSAWGRK